MYCCVWLFQLQFQNREFLSIRIPGCWYVSWCLLCAGQFICGYDGDKQLWFLENTLVFIFLFFLILGYKKFEFSDLSYLLICVYLCLHVYGSSIPTHEETHLDIGFAMLFTRTGNFYDRIVHFSFGFVGLPYA